MVQQLPLFHPYPITDDPVSQREVGQYNAALSLGFHPSPLPQQKTIHNPYELVIHTLDNYGRSGVISKYREAFNAARKLAKKSKSLPTFRETPHSKKYQQTSRGDVDSINSEIDNFGLYLSCGQVLFHGGDTQSPEQSFTTSHQFSTTFCPQIAAWHAYNDGIGKWGRKNSAHPLEAENPTIWILEVSASLNKKALIFHKGGANMSDEMEAVFETGVTVTPLQVTKYEAYKLVTIVQASIT
jgi:hypothetical protein